MTEPSPGHPRTKAEQVYRQLRDLAKRMIPHLRWAGPLYAIYQIARELTGL